VKKHYANKFELNCIEINWKGTPCYVYYARISRTIHSTYALLLH